MAYDLTTFVITTFVAVFAIENPIGAMTSFVVRTRAYPKAMKKRVIQKAVLAATINPACVRVCGELHLPARSVRRFPRSASPGASCCSRLGT